MPAIDARLRRSGLAPLAFFAALLWVTGFATWIVVAFAAARWAEATIGVPSVITFLALVVGMPAGMAAALVVAKD